MTTISETTPAPVPEPEIATYNRDIDLFYELGRFRHQDRGWKKSIGNPNVANVAEHNMRVNYMSVYIALKEGADPYRTLASSQTHDTGESRGIDLTPFEKIYVKCDEDRAIRDTFSDTVLADFFIPLYEEYKQRETLESWCVKDADILDSVLELHELRFQGCMYLEVTQYQLVEKRAKYKTETARKLHDLIVAGGYLAVQRGQQASESTFRNGTYAT